jgi:hypothetical protein
MAEKDPKDPSSTSEEYDRMAPRWKVMNDVLGGTETMREARNTYIPQYPEETADLHEMRIKGATLMNTTEKTLNTLVGKPFSEMPGLSEDFSPEIEEKILPDADLLGNSWDVVCRHWFRSGIGKGLAHLLVDFPVLGAKEEGVARTLEDDRQEGVRPYWVVVDPESVIFASSEIVNGEEVLTQVRIKETVTKQVGFVNVTSQRIKVLYPGRVELWEPVKVKGKTSWQKTSDWVTGMDRIPMVTFYSRKEGFMLAKPPLLDLAYLNIAHWQSCADQRNILRVARFPILACTGADNGKNVVLGPFQVLSSEDSASKFYYVEHTGVAIAAGRQDLQDLEAQMSSYGAEFLKTKQTGNQTATGRALDASEESSDLASMVHIFEDAVAQVLDLTGEWMKIEAAGTVNFNTEWGIDDLTNQADLQVLQGARAVGDLSRKQFLTALKERDVLPSDFDFEANDTELAGEQADFLKTQTDLEPDLKPGDKPPAKTEPAPA